MQCQATVVLEYLYTYGSEKKNTVCFLYFIQYFILFLGQTFGVSKNNFSHWKQYALVFNKYKASITKLNVLYSATLDLCIKKKKKNFFIHI